MSQRRRSKPDPLFARYRPLPRAQDVLFDERGAVRAELEPMIALLDGVGRTRFGARRELAWATFLHSGATFSSYNDGGPAPGLPLDLIPRPLPAARWERIEAGLVQRVRALDQFLRDAYAEQRILEEGVIPRDLVQQAPGYVPALCDVRPAQGAFVHLAGIDLVEDERGEFRVLEDSLARPSGSAYVLENRMVMRKTFPEVFDGLEVAAVESLPERLRSALERVRPEVDDAAGVVVTPGPGAAAHGEQQLLAHRMGWELVEAPDLCVEGGRVLARTTRGPRPVAVIQHLGAEPPDAAAIGEDRLLGVPGLARAYAEGRVALANALGSALADDKGLYAFVPDMIRFYLTEEPILGQVETYVCARSADRTYVLENLERLVVKPVSDGEGAPLLVGPAASRAEQAECRERIRSQPRRYVAQPLVELSTCPTWTQRGVEPRRVDLRAFVVTGASPWVVPGGLTRVALAKGSYVASRDGGSKDTWVLGAPT